MFGWDFHSLTLASVLMALGMSSSSSVTAAAIVVSAADYNDIAARRQPIFHSSDNSRGTWTKRSTIMLDKIAYALQRALNDGGPGRAGNGGGDGGAGRFDGSATSPFVSDDATDTSPLQQRITRDKVFWRCYFNAVSCFRRRRK